MLLAINKRKILQSAQKHLQKGALDKALKDYQTLLKADPKDANVRLKIGDIFLKQGNSEEAVSAYLKVAKRFMDDGFDAKSVALFKQIVRIDPKRLEVYPSLAELYQRLGLNSDAMGALQTAADAHYRDGDRDQALDLLRRMAALDPTNTANRMKVADLLRQEKRVEEAVEEFRAVAEELKRQGDLEGRIVALDRICELASDDHESLLDLGRARLEAGALLEAVEVGERLVAADDEVAEHHELLAEALEKAGKSDACAVHWRRVAELCRARGDESRARDLMQRYGGLETITADASDEPVIDQTDELAFGEVGGDELGLANDEFSDPGFVSQQGMQLGVPMDAGSDEEPLDLDPALEQPAVRDDADFSLEPAEPEDQAGDSDLGAPPSVEADEAEAEGAGELSGDPDQLVAEASVLLRYGKSERAVETLRAVVQARPDHRAALEKLVEALDATGDAGAAEEMRTRLQALDGGSGEEAASEPSATPDGGSGEELFEEMDIELDGEGDADLDSEGSSTGSVEGFDLDLDLDEEDDDATLDSNDDLDDSAPDLVALSPGATPPAPDPAAAQADATIQLDAADDSGVDLDIDLGGDLDVSDPAPVRDLDALGLDEPTQAPDANAATAMDLEASSDELDFDLEEELPDEAGEDPSLDFASEDSDASEPELEPLSAGPDLESDDEDADRDAPEASSARGAEGASATTAQQIVEDLEEAEFYYQQGMTSEAREAYGRVLAVAPNHPQALLRMGELEAAAPQPEAPEPEAQSPAAEEPGLDAGSELFDGPEPALDEFEDLDLDDDEPRPDDTQVSDVDLAASAASDEPLEEPDLDADPGTAKGAGAQDFALDITANLAAKQPQAADAGGDSFDLAAELSDDLDDEANETSIGGTASSTEEEGFEQVFAAFKQGVQRELDEGDHEAHYDLGIAYKEMGLLDDAILEFGQAMKSAERMLPCLHMMGLCALELGRVSDATAHLEQALALPDLPPEQQLGLRYDSGRAYSQSGEVERARSAFEAVLALDPEFADTAERLRALDEAPAMPGDDLDDTAEAFESFDDLLDESAAEPEPGTAPQYESFDDLMGEADDEVAPAAVDAGAQGDDDDLEVVADPTDPPVELELEAEADDVLEPEPIEPEAAGPGEEPDPEPDGKSRRRKKISFV